jgi:hypothetical protein
LSDIAQKVGDPSNEREFDAIDVKFFVIKKGAPLRRYNILVNCSKQMIFTV